jgi:hypothetical protein
MSTTKKASISYLLRVASVCPTITRSAAARKRRSLQRDVGQHDEGDS